MGELLGEITPVSYMLKEDAGVNANGDSPMKAQSANVAGHAQYGFIAQEVKEVYPDLVYEDSEGKYSLDYSGFIPLLVDAIKGLKAQVKTLEELTESQQQVIDSLKNTQPGRIPMQSDGTVVASLSQNRPNPFRISTTIGCVIPQSVSSAFICVYDLNGGQKLRRDIIGRDKVEVTIDGNTLPAGMYIYTLVCDGTEIDSKRMILTD